MQRDLTTRAWGMDLAFPVIVSPAGARAIDPGGETAVARAAATPGIPMGLSSFASHPFESVVAANPNTMYQLYWVPASRSPSGWSGPGRPVLILTVDWAFASRRDWGSPDIPPKIDLPTLVRYSPHGNHPTGLGAALVKGITDPADAREAVQAGADAISVSNHGGNNLDGTPASLQFLPAVVDAVGDQVEGRRCRSSATASMRR